MSTALEALARDLMARLSQDYGDNEEVDEEIEELFLRCEALIPIAESTAHSKAVNDVLVERDRQDAKWGEQNLDPFTYLAILTEEVGELSQAALHTKFGGPAAVGLYAEAVHTAAVALAIVECLNRGKWRWPE